MPAAQPTTKRSYEVFEPYGKWYSDEEEEILRLDLKGFNKEQLKVQTNNKGMLIIYGERPLDESKWCRFRKEINLSKDCNSSEIRAKFSQGDLSIVMPKKGPVKQASENEAVEGTKEAPKGSVWGVKINKRRAFKVAVVVVVVVVMVALRTQIVRFVHRFPHRGDSKEVVADA